MDCRWVKQREIRWVHQKDCWRVHQREICLGKSLGLRSGCSRVMNWGCWKGCRLVTNSGCWREQNSDRWKERN